jgi:hypothetical protein
LKGLSNSLQEELLALLASPAVATNEKAPHQSAVGKGRSEQVGEFLGAVISQTTVLLLAS